MDNTPTFYLMTEIVQEASWSIKDVPEVNKYILSCSKIYPRIEFLTQNTTNLIYNTSYIPHKLREIDQEAFFFYFGGGSLLQEWRSGTQMSNRELKTSRILYKMLEVKIFIQLFRYSSMSYWYIIVFCQEDFST